MKKVPLFKYWGGTKHDSVLEKLEMKFGVR